MERSEITSLVNKFIQEYYESGSTTGIYDLLAEDVIAFGVGSLSYVQGREPVMELLAANRNKLSMVKVRKIACGEVGTVQGFTIRAAVEFSTHNRKHITHRLLMMFREGEAGCLLCGINVQRGFASFLYNLHYDRLTNLYNKKAFCRNAAEILEKYPDLEFEIMRFNIARFKVINDLFGEDTGDKLLRYVAQFLSSIQLTPCVYGRLMRIISCCVIPLAEICGNI
jgi:GGDEF domain-containing protein